MLEIPTARSKFGHLHDGNNNGNTYDLKCLN